MTLEEIIPKLTACQFHAVLVTGPQRSGTTLTAHILANELGYRYVDEDEFHIHNHHEAQRIICQENAVLQAPALCHVAHLFKSCAVVVVRRDLQEILESENRINWREAYGGANLKAEQDKYLKTYNLQDDNIARLKYFVWDIYQLDLLGERAFDLDYDSLRGHSLWLEKERRKEFTARQWQETIGEQR